MAINPSYDNINELADFYYDLKRFPDAIRYYNQILPLATVPMLKADLLDRLSHSLDMIRKAGASDAQIEAVNIYKGVVEENPGKRWPHVAQSMVHLGDWQERTGDREAEKSYRRALEIFREHAALYPDIFQPDVALTLNRLGGWLENRSWRGESMPLYLEALGIYREFATKYPDKYLPEVASTLTRIGALLYYSSAHETKIKAKAPLMEAVEIYGKLAEKNP